MGKEEERESAILKRWKRKVRSDSELSVEVQELASRLLDSVRLFVEERRYRLVERVVMDAALVPITLEKPAYVV